MNKGKEFEELVALIERTFHNLPGTKVEHDVWMKNDKGVERQIDVLITFNSGRFIFKTLVECRNTKSKIKLSDIDAFKEKMESVGGHQGVIVSASGYQKGVLKSYINSKIKLYQLSQAAKLEKYLREFRLNFYSLTHKSIDIGVTFKEANEISKNVLLRTPLDTPSLDRKITLLEIANDYLKQYANSIIDILRRNYDATSGNNQIIGETAINVRFTVPLNYKENGSNTEIVGFDATIETTLNIKELEVINVSEYKDLTDGKVHALVFDFKSDIEIQKLMDKHNASVSVL